MKGYVPTGEIIKDGMIYKPVFCLTYGFIISRKYTSWTIHHGTCNECTAKKIKVKCTCKDE